MSALTPNAEAWLAEGEVTDVDGRSIFVRSREGPGPTLLLLHGFPSSSFDWRGMLEALPDQRSVFFDFLGFGLSEKPRDHVYSLHRQADLAEAIAKRYGDGPLVLVAHDMGTSVASELMARDLEGKLGIELAAVLLFNGSMILERASLTPSQKILRSRLGPVLARLSSERIFRLQMGRIFSDAHPLSDEEAADQWALLERGGGNRILHKLTAYLGERVRFAERWHGALRDWPGRLRLAWGMQDPVATVSVLDGILELRPQAPVTRWGDLGHYPQIEEPRTVAAEVARTLAQTEVGSTL